MDIEIESKKKNILNNVRLTFQKNNWSKNCVIENVNLDDLVVIFNKYSNIFDSTSYYNNLSIFNEPDKTLKIQIAFTHISNQIDECLEFQIYDELSALIKNEITEQYKNIDQIESLSCILPILLFYSKTSDKYVLAYRCLTGQEYSDNPPPEKKKIGEYSYLEYTDEGQIRLHVNCGQDEYTFTVPNESPLTTSRLKSKGIRNRVWEQYFGKEENKCNSCPICQKIPIFCNESGGFQIGHVIPKSKGGPNHLDNLRPICMKCNSEMSSTDMIYYCYTMQYMDSPLFERLTNNIYNDHISILGYNLNQLKQLAKDRGLVGYSKLNRNDLLGKLMGTTDTDNTIIDESSNYMTVSDLRKQAKTNGFSGYSKMNRQQLLELLESSNSTASVESPDIISHDTEVGSVVSSTESYITVKELRKTAKDRGITGYSKMKRQELLDLLGG